MVYFRTRFGCLISGALAGLALAALSGCGDAMAPVDSGRRTDVPTTSDAARDVVNVNDGNEEMDVPSSMDVAGRDVVVTNDGPSNDRPTTEGGVTDAPNPVDSGSGGCASNRDCARGQVCRNIARCGARGVCEAVALCGRPSPDAAVCGCDGVNYASSCEAFNAGVGVASMGVCGVNPGTCRSNADCAAMPGTVCFGIAMCGGTGRCSPPPPCAAIDAPVCGCDNRTYTNSCVAQASGVGVAHDGPCGAVDCRVDAAQGCCRADSDCGRGRYCAPLNLCVAGSAKGVCKDPLPPPIPGMPTQCWRDSDCGRGTCRNARICECGARCIVADQPGTCG
jgi:hypothetical protein